MAPKLKSAKTAIIAMCLVGLSAGLIAWGAGWLTPRQTLPGRLVDYHAIYDTFWDVACDTAMDGSDRRCYIQYVDVYRPRPDFAAAMVEVVFHPGDTGQPDPHVRFDIEPGYSFRDATLNVSTPDGELPLDVSGCRSNTCIFTGDAGRAVLTAWRKGTTLDLELDEGRDALAKLSWPLGNINAILDDFAVQRRARNLP